MGTTGPRASSGLGIVWLRRVVCIPGGHHMYLWMRQRYVAPFQIVLNNSTCMARPAGCGSLAAQRG